MVRKLLNAYKNCNTHAKLAYMDANVQSYGEIFSTPVLAIALLFYLSLILKHKERIFTSDTRKFITLTSHVFTD